MLDKQPARRTKAIVKFMNFKPKKLDFFIPICIQKSYQV